jgi:sugar/nucleoside kinase (ribokinase family)
MLDLKPKDPHRHSEELLRMGAGIVVLKMGERGLYLKSSSTLDRLFFLNRLGYSHLDAWCSIEHRSPCFKVAVAGTTGAGDCAIAGFLTSLLKGLSPPKALQMAAAAGASSVEKVDATSGVPTWHDLTQRVAKGWDSHLPETD